MMSDKDLMREIVKLCPYSTIPNDSECKDLFDFFKEYAKTNYKQGFSDGQDSMLHNGQVSLIAVEEADKHVKKARIKGIIEALEGTDMFYYDNTGNQVILSYLSLKDRLRPEGEDPGYSLPVSEAIEFYEDKLKEIE